MSCQRKKLMIYAPYAIWGPHFETELELAQRHLDAGGDVVFLCCSGGLLTCFPNQEHRPSICRMCKSRFEKGIAWLGRSRVTVKDFLNVTLNQQHEIDRLAARPFLSHQEVRSFTIHGADIGVGVISSIISILREPEPDVVQNKELIRVNLISAGRTFFSIFNHLQDEAPDKFIVFNGRYAQLRPALSAARMLNVDAHVHERAGVLDRFSLTSNTTPHDIVAIQQEMLNVFNSSGEDFETKQLVAYEWFNERRNNVTQGWESFTKQQKKGHLPELAKDRLNLVIFNSSEDELEAFEEWHSPYYANQNEGIEKLLSDPCINDKFKIFIREHPNLKNVVNSQTRGLRDLCSIHDDAHLIPSDSPVSTYSLIDECDIVLTFGSTVGIEAVCSGKPSFLVGRAYYENLDCCVIPRSHAELVALLLAFAAGGRNMLPSVEKCRKAVAVYGFFNKRWGHRFTYATVLGLRTLRMVREGRARRLKPSLYSWLLFKVEELIHGRLWS